MRSKPPKHMEAVLCEGKPARAILRGGRYWCSRCGDYLKTPVTTDTDGTMKPCITLIQDGGGWPGERPSTGTDTLALPPPGTRTPVGEDSTFITSGQTGGWPTRSRT